MAKEHEMATSVVDQANEDRPHSSMMAWRVHVGPPDVMRFEQVLRPNPASLSKLVYGVMNYIVLPMSAAGSGSKDPLWIGLSILVHMFLIGVPCAVFARRSVLARQFAS
jgi:hypothetical protein